MTASNPVAAAIGDTKLLLRLRWRMLRSRRTRVGVMVGLGVIVVLVYAASNAGLYVRLFAEQTVGTPLGLRAARYLVAFEHGDLADVGAVALAAVFAAALIPPLTGTINTALMAHEELVGVRPTRRHRYTDSFITLAVSSIGLLQLVTLTGVGSVLTVAGGRTFGLLFVWAAWPVLLMLSLAEGWAVEWVRRAWSPRTRLGAAAVGAIALGSAVLVDPDRGSTLFGVADAFAGTITAATDQQWSRFGFGVGLTVLVGVMAAVLGWVACGAALNRPEPASIKPRRRRGLLVRTPTRPGGALLHMMVMQMIRTAEIRRPLIVVAAAGLCGVFLSDPQSAAVTLVIAVPLAVGLAWGVNMFGVLGSAMPWLLAQPRVVARLLTYGGLIQVAATVGLVACLWAPPLAIGRISIADAAALAAGTGVATMLGTRSSFHKAIHRPYSAYLGRRGEVLVPPLTALNYTARLALWSGQVGAVVLRTDDAWIQWTLVGVAVVWTSLRWLQLAYRWKDRALQARVASIVAT